MSQGSSKNNAMSLWPAAPRVLAVLSCALALLAINPAMANEILVRQLPASVLMTRKTLASASFENHSSRFGPAAKVGRAAIEILPPLVLRQQNYIALHAALSPPIA